MMQALIPAYKTLSGSECNDYIHDNWYLPKALKNVLKLKGCYSAFVKELKGKSNLEPDKEGWKGLDEESQQCHQKLTLDQWRHRSWKRKKPDSTQNTIGQKEVTELKGQISEQSTNKRKEISLEDQLSDNTTIQGNSSQSQEKRQKNSKKDKQEQTKESKKDN
jgi:hypothetical protein